MTLTTQEGITFEFINHTGQDLEIESTINELMKCTVYFSDMRAKHWAFDFRHNGLWIENITFSNDLMTCKAVISK
ncbi:hypothetical protein [Mammaliicoccus lentus]|uniref:hypothetical protein n=1 Tax=Mammaliicoccus lentus TaxID=42858 RepID=UPI001071B980|nr:hypothetical protein [Mammaliicoccus lentus]MBF0795213.1 hypothetical protein [Mammaliicoccus lentus]TFV14610.1 hypothetical protein E4T78_11135 [Mammaliicoccus lentus]